MCYFITLEMPNEYVEEWQEKLPGSISIGPNIYPELQSSIADNDLICITHDGCSCDLFRRSKNTEEDKLRNKYKKKGWSNAKIDRALANHSDSGQNKDALSLAFESWLCDLAALNVPVRLFVHWDSKELKQDKTTSIISNADLRERKVRIPEEKWVEIENRT
jgi:hypothetical protein